jgi:class 3 adenylate cyclase
MGLQDALRSGVSLALQVRIAVHAGEMTVGPGTVSGDPVTLAAAMAGLVPPGEVFLTETVRLSMNRLGLALEPRGWLPLAGGRAIALYRCSAAAPEALSGNVVRHAPVRAPKIAAGSGGAELWRRARERLRNWKWK